MTHSAPSCKPNPAISAANDDQEIPWGDAFTAKYTAISEQRSDRYWKARNRREARRAENPNPGLKPSQRPKKLAEIEAYVDRMREADNPASRLSRLGGKLPSDAHPILKLFVAKVNRAWNGLLTGTDKEVVVRSDSKLVALFDPYVVVNRQMVGVIRVDIDDSFEDVESLRMAVAACLSEYAGPHKIAMPNLVVGLPGRPHLLWLLEHSVCCTKKGRQGPQLFLHQVERSLTYALRDIGADSGGLSNRRRVKNPLSAWWNTEILAEEPYTLDRISHCVDLAVNDHEINRAMRQDTVKEGVITKKGAKKARVSSNDFFEQLRKFAFDEVAAFKADDDVELEDFKEHVLSQARALVDKMNAGTERLACRVASFTWKNWKPSLQPGYKNRGVLCDEVEGLDIPERQAVGGAYAAEKRRKSSLSRCKMACKEVIAEGVKPTQKAIAERAGVSVPTVRRLWVKLKLKPKK